MRYVITLAACVPLVVGAIKGNTNPFTYDKKEVQEAFAPISKVENYLIQSQNPDISQMNGISSSELSKISFNMDKIVNNLLYEPPLGIPSFIWGFCLGWVGILIVYLVSEDKEETKKALYGCIVGSLVGVVFYIVVWILILGSTAFWM